MANSLTESLDMFQTYLGFIKEMGIDALPLENGVLDSINCRINKKNISRVPVNPLPGKPAQITQRYGNKTNDTPNGIRTELGECVRCKLRLTRKNIVFGEGNPDAKLLIIGDAPTEQDDLQGHPFVGKEGQLLTKIIENGIGLKRGDTYLTNIVKCRPSENRGIKQDEINACRPFIEKQIVALVKPEVILTLGGASTSMLMGRQVSIDSERGKWFRYKGISVMPTFHPSYIIRNYTYKVRKQVFDDVKKIKEILKNQL